MVGHYARTAGNLLRGRLTYVHAGVTHRCNLRCTMCRLWTRAGKLPEAPPERWREVARILAARGATTVSLGGGEPFCRQDLPDIVAAFADANFRVRVLTNGVAPDRDKLRACLQAGMADLSFSLDTLNPELQARLDGLPGGLLKRQENMKRLMAEEFRPLNVLINTVITAYNLDELPRVADLAYDSGFMISFIPVHLDDSGSHDFFGDDLKLGFGPNDAGRLREVVRRLSADKQRRGHIINSRRFLQAIPAFLLEGRAVWPCKAGAVYLSLRPDAKASICHHYETSEAIEVEQIDKQWTARVREKMIADCPGCLRPCWTEVSFLTTSPGAMWDQVHSLTRRRPRRATDPSADKASAGSRENK